MANINEILARAAALRDETALNSISPERAGGIMYDTLLALNELWLQQGAALVISKIYASVAAMEADTAPVSDLTGKPLRPGQIVVIASSDSDNGSVYRYNGTESPSWSLVGSIGNLEPVDSLDSDSTTLPLAAHQGKVLDGKISQLGQKTGLNSALIPELKFGLGKSSPINGLVANDNTFKLNQGSHKIIQVVGGTKINITTRGNFKAQVFWLKSYQTPTANVTLPDFCANHTSRESLDSGIYTAPDDCVFVAIGYMSGSTLIFPNKVLINGFDADSDLFGFLSLLSSSSATYENLDRILYGPEFSAFPAWPASNGTYNIGATNGSAVLPVIGGAILRIIPKLNNSTQLFLCKSFEIPTAQGQSPDLCAGETGRRTIATDTTITLPDDCRFVVYGMKNSNVNVGPDAVYLNGIDMTNGLYNYLLANQYTINAYERNKDKTGRLLNACRKNIESSGSKDTQIILLGDQHKDSLAISNAIEIMNGFDSVDAMLNMGDCSNAFNDGYSETYFSLLEKAQKPVYHTLGNHDVGYSPLVGVAGSNKQCFDKWIAPIIEKGWLNVGEYTDGKCYYYHDFTEGKTRLIVLYAYDDNNDFFAGYWTPITYDSGYADIVNGQEYSTGAKVNVPGYTEHSFECVQDVTPNTSTTSPTRPSYKFNRGINVIRQEQAQWYLDTLASTPEDYAVVVAIHGVPTEQFIIDHNKGGVFCQDLNKTASQFGGYGMYDFVADAINAFVNGTVFNRTITFKSYTGYDGISAKYAEDYVVSKDFSVKNPGVTFHCFLCGHTHYDLVWKHGTYLQYCINPIGANTNYARNHVFGEGGISATDICRTDTDGPAKDSLTIASFNHSRGMKKVALAKIGVDVTIDAVKRDYAILDLSD